jgi:hypothetical protein
VENAFAGWLTMPDFVRVAGLMFAAAVFSSWLPAIAAPWPLAGALHEEEARFLPGIYYFHKGGEYSRHGQTAAAIQTWKLAAGWAIKEAQYNLGIVYFKGEGVAVDRPRGLAWLALAAERKDVSLETSLAAAWEQSTPAERENANAIWRDLVPRYADAVALPRAQTRFDGEIAQITGSRVGMPGHVTVWTHDGPIDGAVYRWRMQRLAEVNFGTLPSGHVDVGPLRAVDDGNGQPPPQNDR